MQKKTMKTKVRLWLRALLTLLAEAAVWGACLRVSADIVGTDGQGWIALSNGSAVLFYAIVRSFIPSNAYSRTARRDQVVAGAMRTALIVSAAAVVVFGRHGLVAVSFLMFGVALAVLRLVLNSIFVRYSIAHPQQAIILCSDETLWQQKALQQNTYGLRLHRLATPTAGGLEACLAEHPRSESLFLDPTALPAKDMEDVAHLCRKHGLALHLLPWPGQHMSVPVRSEWRGSVGLVSPARLPLQHWLWRAAKRLTDIVLSLLVLLTLFPLVYLVAFILIKRQSRGPVIVASHLQGMDGKPFQSLTFRTRHHRAAPSLFAGEGDPGYFPFGKFLAASRLEFMPQLLCVLRGSMTLVGTQQIRPAKSAEYRRELRQHFVPRMPLKVGLTSYRLPSDGQGSTQADVWYCRNWGYWLDLRIMLRRLGELLSRPKARHIPYI